MLEIFNNLRPFFEDCYRRISVREYAKIISVSPPTASSLLNAYLKSNLLIKEIERNYIFFHANSKEKQFIDLSRIYWSIRLGNFLHYLEKELVPSAIVLFGSLSKGETKSDSDLDLAIFANKKNLNIKKYEEELERRFQIFWFKSTGDVKNKELMNNILNGYLLKGRLSL